MDEATLAVMARLDLVRDDVSDIKTVLREQQKEHASHGERLTEVESSLLVVKSNQEKILDGPVYSLDRFITKRVAQMTGGMGMVLYILYSML
mgnify:CR=1 FL=1|tara:strand:+ start:10425 stop:10700 length:276 start_codon:yes stop_codon:yes gene_type:complete